MRTANRNRRRYSVALICLALILLCVGSVSALSANYTVAENGTAYFAEVEVLQAEEYSFTEPGLLGEPVPVEATGIMLLNATGPVNYTEERSAIRFRRATIPSATPHR